MSRIKAKSGQGSKSYKVIGTMFNREYVVYVAGTETQAEEWIEKQKRSYGELKLRVGKCNE